VEFFQVPGPYKGGESGIFPISRDYMKESQGPYRNGKAKSNTLTYFFIFLHIFDIFLHIFHIFLHISSYCVIFLHIFHIFLHISSYFWLIPSHFDNASYSSHIPSYFLHILLTYSFIFTSYLLHQEISECDVIKEGGRGVLANPDIT